MTSLCAGCGKGNEDGPLKKCSGCMRVAYCTAACQRADWKSHKLLCKLNAIASKAERASATNNNVDDAAPDFDITFEADKFKREQSVVVRGLAKAAEYNGLRGKVVRSPHDGNAEGRKQDGRIVVEVALTNGACKTVRLQPGNLFKPCNVDACVNPAQSRCGRCKLRVYCSPSCRDADWIDHKVYCEAPSTPIAYTKEQMRTWYAKQDKFRDKDEELSAFEEVPLPAFGEMWARFKKARGANVPNINFEGFVIEYCLESIGSPFKDHVERINDIRAVRLGDPATHRELMALPWMCRMTATPQGASLSISYSCFGVDEGTGELQYMLVCIDMDSGHQRFTGHQNGKPTKYDYERALYLSCTRPMPLSPGEGGLPVVPCRPSFLLVAFRWGDETRAHIKATCDKLGIYTHFETSEAAAKSAKEFGTDPMGMNIVKGSEKGLGKHYDPKSTFGASVSGVCNIANSKMQRGKKKKRGGSGKR